MPWTRASAPVIRSLLLLSHRGRASSTPGAARELTGKLTSVWQLQLLRLLAPARPSRLTDTWLGPCLSHLLRRSPGVGAAGCVRAARALSTTRRAAEVFRPTPPFPTGTSGTHDVIVNVGEAGLGELIIQPVVPAAVASHVDFQGVEIFLVLPERCLRAGTGVWRRISP